MGTPVGPVVEESSGEGKWEPCILLSFQGCHGFWFPGAKHKAFFVYPEFRIMRPFLRLPILFCLFIYPLLFSAGASHLA